MSSMFTRAPRILRGPAVPAKDAPTDPSDQGRAAARAYLNDLASKFPLSDTIAASFTGVAIPADLATTVAAGKSAWLSLINFDPWEKLQQDIVTFGFFIDMASCDYNPADPGTQAAWGDARGLGAALVVGGSGVPVGAPTAAGTWTGGDCPIAGVESGTPLVVNDRGRKMWSRTFPAGAFTGSYQKRGLNGAIVPFVRRFTKGDSLRAGLVLNRTQAVAGVNKTLNGYVDVEIYFGFTKNIWDLEG